MSIRLNTTSARVRRWLGLTMSLACVAGLLAAPGIARAGDGDAVKADEEQIAPGAVDVQRKFVAAYNAKNWDEVAGSYAEDAIMIPPNHEPIKGRAAILEYWKSVRDTVGEARCGEAMDRVGAGKYVAAVGRDCTAFSGSLGFTFHELVERGEDGTWRYKFDMFGLR